MRRFAITLSLASCASHAMTMKPDAASAGDATRDGQPTDTPGDSSAACTPWAMMGGCCVFGDACPSGRDCSWRDTNEPAPDRSHGFCLLDGSATEGAACAPNNGNGGCAPGLYCAWNNGQIPDPGTGFGTCRAYCDPADAATHGCATGKTCVGMPVCDATHVYPDCPSSTTGNVGYCL